MRVINASILVLVLIFGSNQLLAKSPKKSIQELVDASEWIFVGEVVEVASDALLYDRFGALGKARVRVIERIKGAPYKVGYPEEELDFLRRPDMVETPRLKVGDTMVFFWVNSAAGPTLVPGHYGARSVDRSGYVNTRLIAGMPDRLSLAEFKILVNSLVRERTIPSGE